MNFLKPATGKDMTLYATDLGIDIGTSTPAGFVFAFSAGKAHISSVDVFVEAIKGYP